MHEEHSTIRTYTIIFAWLVVLMFLTIFAALLELGPFNLPVAMLIAIVKATLVIMFFMHVKYSGRLVWVFSSAAFLWLGILLVLTFSDYLSRGWVPRRLPSEPAAALFREPRILAEPAPSPSGQGLRNPRAIPSIERAPGVTTQPAPGQPAGLD